jgi:ABC-type microcin C transport system permease subunit YejE
MLTTLHTYHNGCFWEEISQWFRVNNALAPALQIAIITQIALQTSLWELVFILLIFSLEKAVANVRRKERRDNSIRAGGCLDYLVVTALHVAAVLKCNTS